MHIYEHNSAGALFSVRALRNRIMIHIDVYVA